jgi:hypothetical protein
MKTIVYYCFHTGPAVIYLTVKEAATFIHDLRTDKVSIKENI